MSVEHVARTDISGADLPLASSLSRKCSTCGRTGHNSRTCLESREATAATNDCLPSAAPAQTAEGPRQQAAEKGRPEDDGAASDESAGAHHREGRKKGVAWTEEEHRMFLLGLQKLGKGDWRGISRQYVQTRSPTQVASHAQKYFIRQSIAGKRKRRSSLFDLVPDNTEKEVSSPKPNRHEEPSQARHPTEQQNLPQMGVTPGTGPEALAMAYWYHALMAQHHQVPWLQAMYNQVQPSQLFLPLPPAVAAMMTSGQGFLHPQLLQQAFLSLPQPGAANGQQPSIAGPNPALASAYLAHQQHMAAYAMSMDPEALQKAAGTPPNMESGGHERHATGRSEPPQTQPLARAKVLERSESRLSEASGESGVPLTAGRSHVQAETFGNGRLVRPKAQKAQTSVGSFGEMPSYMLGSQEPGSYLASGSAESQETGLRVSHFQAPNGCTPMDASGSTNGAFSGSSNGAFGADEQSANRGSRFAVRRADQDPAQVVRNASEISCPDEVRLGDPAGAGKGMGSDASRSPETSPDNTEHTPRIEQEQECT